MLAQPPEPLVPPITDPLHPGERLVERLRRQAITRLTPRTPELEEPRAAERRPALRRRPARPDGRAAAAPGAAGGLAAAAPAPGGPDAGAAGEPDSRAARVSSSRR